MMTGTSFIHRLVLFIVASLLLSMQQQTMALLVPPGVVPVGSSSSSSRRAFLQTATVSVGVGTIATTVGIAQPANAATQTLPSTNTKAPYFDLPNSKGTGATSLTDLIKDGKWTVLYFYPGAFTSGCTLQARYFQRDIDQYRNLNTQIVGVSVDPPEKNAQFCAAENLDFFMLSDIEGRISKLYGTAISVPGWGTFSNRQTYIIDPNGDLRWVFTDVQSRLQTHSAEVIAKLQELEGVITTTTTA